MIAIQLQPMANHLWQSTLFAGAAALLILILRRNRAAARYWLWLVASIKFLVPFSLLMMLGSEFGRHTTTAVTQSALSSVMEQVSEPFAAPVSLAIEPKVQGSPATLIASMVCGMWALGSTILVFSWWRRWRALRAAPRGGPGTRDPEHLTWSYATLKGLLMKAYDVKAYQVSGPQWLDTERYDIAAKVP